MKILFAIKSLRGGGAQKLINDISILITSEGKHQCEVLILTDKEERFLSNLRKHGIHVEIIPSKCRSHISRMRYMSKYILQNNFDIVHANMFPTFYYCSIIKKFHRKKFPKLVMTEHSTDNHRRHHQLFRYIDRFIYRSYDHVISISDKTQEHLLNWISPNRTERKKYSVAYDGIPLQIYYDAKPYTRKALFPAIADNDRLVGMIGAFKEAKNHAMIIEVLSLLPLNYKLILVGIGDLQETVWQQVKEKGLEERVAMLGFRKDIPEITQTIDIVVIPSKWEGFGLVAIEAMACGKPIVATDIPGLAEVVGDAGIKVPLNDIQAFADAIVSLENRDLYETYSQIASKRAELFSIEKTYEKYKQIFIECLHKKGRIEC